jgi:hypothetical protein
MIDKVRFSPSVLRGIRKLAIRAIGPKELASSVTEAYGSNAVETAMQISEELHGSAWMKDPGTDRKAVPRHNDPHSGRISKVRKDIEATVRLRNQFSSQKHQSISETVSKLPAAVHLEEKPPSATGDEAAPTGKAFESGNTNKDTYPPVPDDLEPGNVSNKCVVPPLGQRTRAEIVNKSDAEALSNKKSWIFGWWVGRSFSRSRRNDTFRTVIAFDLLPINRTSHFSKKSINPENDGHENKQIQRRANHWFSAAGRSRYADQGDWTQARFQ